MRTVRPSSGGVFISIGIHFAERHRYEVDSNDVATAAGHILQFVGSIPATRAVAGDVLCRTDGIDRGTLAFNDVWL